MIYLIVPGGVWLYKLLSEQLNICLRDKLIHIGLVFGPLQPLLKNTRPLADYHPSFGRRFHSCYCGVA